MIPFCLTPNSIKYIIALEALIDSYIHKHGQLHLMWKLSMRGARGTPFTELGSFASLNDAARVILEKEGQDSTDVLFLRVSVAPMTFDDWTDADILSTLEYQSAKHYYALTRDAN